MIGRFPLGFRSCLGDRWQRECGVLDTPWNGLEIASGMGIGFLQIRSRNGRFGFESLIRCRPRLADGVLGGGEIISHSLGDWRRSGVLVTDAIGGKAPMFAQTVCGHPSISQNRVDTLGQGQVPFVQLTGGRVDSFEHAQVIVSGFRAGLFDQDSTRRGQTDVGRDGGDAVLLDQVGVQVDVDLDRDDAILEFVDDP